MKNIIFDTSYDIAILDVGSPRLGNLGWAIINNKKINQGQDLDQFFGLYNIEP